MCYSRVSSPNNTNEMTAISSELSLNDLNDLFFEIMRSETNAVNAANFIYDSVLDDVLLGYLFDFHHGLKTGLTDLVEGEKEEEEQFKIVNSPECDVFGFSIMKKTPDTNCSCPNCDRPVAATRFAPHLEKCMGMGRNSSRIASRRIASNSREPASYAGLLSDDEDDADWAGGSLQGERRKRRMKTNNSRKPNKIIKSTRCPTEDRRALRNNMLEPSTPESQTVGLTAEDAGSPPDSSPSSSCSSSSRKRDRHRAKPKSKNKRERILSPPRE